MEYAVDGVLWRDLAVQPKIDAVDVRLIGDRRDVVWRAVGNARRAQIGWCREEWHQRVGLRGDQVRRNLVIGKRNAGERVIELRRSQGGEVAGSHGQRRLSKTGKTWEA